MTTSSNSPARPSLVTQFLFLLLLSGPPKFRLRDPNASLDLEIDWVIILQVVTWLFAAVWIALHWQRSNRVALTDRLQRWTIVLFSLLAFSALFSTAPAFTAFKVYQLVITFLFIAQVLRLYGLDQLLTSLFYGCAILALADIVAAFVMPDLVYVATEFWGRRFRGDLLAQTGEVSVIGLFLLLTIKSDLPRWKFTFWAVVLGSVLFLSLMRTSYLVVLLVLLLAAFRPPPIPILRRTATLVLVALPFLCASLLSLLNEQRDVEDLWTLSDRLGLWNYLIEVTMRLGPWFGLGYFAASRTYGPDYNPELGNAHSAFMEVFAGGGLLALAVFLFIWLIVARRAWRLYTGTPTQITFAVVSLFFASLFINAIGGELQAEPAGFCFWCTVLALVHLQPEPQRLQSVASIVPNVAHP